MNVLAKKRGQRKEEEVKDLILYDLISVIIFISHFFFRSQPNLKFKFIFISQSVAFGADELESTLSFHHKLPVSGAKKIQNKFFFGIVTSKDAKDRRSFSWNSWLKNAVKRGHYYAMTSYEEKLENYATIKVDNSFYDPYLDLNKTNNTKFFLGNKDRAFKRLSCLQYFIDNTDAKYAFVTCDDVIIQTKRLDWLMQQLDKDINDTSTDIYIWGDCNSYNGVMWLQGGVGYIFTRAAARACLMHKVRWMKEFKRADDLDFGLMLNYINFPIQKTETPYFIGHGLVAIPNSIQQAKKCPNMVHSNTTCGLGLNSLSDVVGIHENNQKKRDSGMKKIQKLQKISNNFYWYNRKYTSYICYKPPK